MNDKDTRSEILQKVVTPTQGQIVPLCVATAFFYQCDIVCEVLVSLVSNLSPR